MTCHARWPKQTKTHTRNKNLQSFVLLFSISHCSRRERFICEQNGQKSSGDGEADNKEVKIYIYIAVGNK